MKQISSRILLVVVLLISLWGAWLRVSSYSHRDWSADENYHISYFKPTLWQTMQQMPTYEFSSYMTGHQYITYPFWKVFGASKWGLAIPRLIAILLTYWLLWRLCVLFRFGFVGMAVAFAVVNFNETLIWHAMEIRPYAFLIPLSMGIFYALVRFIEGYEGLPKFNKLLYGVFFISSILFHTHNIFIFFLSGMYLLLSARWRQQAWLHLFKAWFFWAIVAMLTLPIFLYCIKGSNHMPFFSNTVVFQFIPSPYENLLGFFKCVIGNLLSPKALHVLLLAPLLAAFIPHQERLEEIGWFCVMVLGGVFIVFALNVLNAHWFVQRFFIWVYPFFALYIAWTADSVCRLMKQKFVSRG